MSTRLPSPEFLNKIFSLDQLKDRASHLPHPIVMTNGVFDILHAGHVTYLAQARDLGKLFKNPCSQAELNKIVPFGFSLQRQKMVFFCHQNSIILLC